MVFLIHQNLQVFTLCIFEIDAIISFSISLEDELRILYQPPKKLVQWAKEDAWFDRYEYEWMCETMILSMHRITNDIMLKLNSELYKKLFSSNINKSQTIIVELAKKYNQANENNQESILNSESEEIVIEDKDFKGKLS